MENYYSKNVSPIKWGALIAMITLLYGFGMGITFGTAEDSIMDNFEMMAREAPSDVYKNDKAKMNKITDKSWEYLKRAHFHANGLGVIALALIILLSFMMNIPNILKTLTSLALGIGSLGYSLGWMFAGLKAPSLGSTDLSKEAISWLAIPSALLCVIGLISVILFFLYEAFIRKTNNK